MNRPNCITPSYTVVQLLATYQVSAVTLSQMYCKCIVAVLKVLYKGHVAILRTPQSSVLRKKVYVVSIPLDIPKI